MKSITATSSMGSFTWNQSVNGTTMRNIEGFEYSDIISVVNTFSGRNGGYFVNSKLGTRVISWTGDLTEDDPLQQRRNMIKALPVGEEVTVTFTTYDDVDLQVSGVVRRLSLPYSKQKSVYLVEFECPDHRLLSQTLNTNSTQPTVTTGGTAIPTAIPLSLASTSGVGVLEITNSGTVSSTPEITIHGSGTNFTIQNQTTNEIITLDTTLTSSESVTIDLDNREVTKSNGQNLFGQFTGNLSIAPGNNSIYFNASSGTDGNTLLTIKHRNAYGGV